MPIYEFKSPDGKTYEIEGPEGSTHEQAFQVLQSQLGAQAPTQPKQPAPSAAGSLGRATGGMGLAGEFIQSAGEVPAGLVQFAANRIPGLGGFAPAVNEAIAQQRQGYDAARMEEAQAKIAQIKADPKWQAMAARDPNMAQYFISRELPGTTLAGIGGSLAGGAVLPVGRAAKALPAGAPAAVRAAAPTVGAMGTGALYSQAATQPGREGVPVTPEQFAEESNMRAAIGAALPLAGMAAGRAIRPVGGAEVQALRAEGIRPTIGQTLGPFARKVEEQAKSLPGLGYAISTAEAGAQKEFRQALANRALGNVGEKLPKSLDGQELVRHVGDTLSNKYDQVLSTITPRRIDTTLAADAQAIRANLSGLPPEVLRDFDAYTGREILSLAKKGYLTGEDFKRIESQLGSRERALRTSPDMNARDLADALGDMRGAMREWLARKTPEKAEQLRAINRGWSELIPIEIAASRTGAAAGGEFTAAGAYQAAKAANASVRKRAAGRGEMQNQDLIEAAARRLGSKEPDSGTAGRLMIGSALTGAGGAMNLPATLGALAAGSAPYVARGTMSNLLSGAPQQRNTLADLIQRAATDPKAVRTLSIMMNRESEQ